MKTKKINERITALALSPLALVLGGGMHLPTTASAMHTGNERVENVSMQLKIDRDA